MGKTQYLLAYRWKKPNAVKRFNTTEFATTCASSKEEASKQFFSNPKFSDMLVISIYEKVGP